MLEQQTDKRFAVHGAAQFNVSEMVASVIEAEARSLLSLGMSLPKETGVIVDKILNTSGKVVLSGIGKSGLVAQKVAATFSSLGIPAIFMHACDGLHGDIGVFQKHDLFLGLSKSGTGSELEAIYSFLKNQSINSVLICCNQGDLSTLADLVVQLPFQREACLLNLAPTTSSTLMMAFCDALAVSVSSIKKFNKNDFAKNHPSGALGRRLTLTVGHFMYSGDLLPLIAPTSSFSEILYTISSKKLGIGIVVDDCNKLLGIITDGDLRRACDKFGPSVFNKFAADVMTLSPKTIDSDELALDALRVMEGLSITSLIVINGECVVGVVHIHDLIKAGIKG